MKINRKVPAFTLMEVTIAMLIAAIAIAITYTAYRIISGTYISYTKKQDVVATYAVVDQLLKRDFLQADQILSSGKGLQMESPKGVIRYEFNRDYLLRDQDALRTDTFKLPAAVKLFFEHEPAANGARVDELHLDTQLEGQSVSLIYQKTYSSQNLIH